MTAMEHIHSEEFGLIDELCEKFHKVLAKFLRKVFYVARIFESDPIWGCVGKLCVGVPNKAR